METGINNLLVEKQTKLNKKVTVILSSRYFSEFIKLLFNQLDMQKQKNNNINSNKALHIVSTNNSNTNACLNIDNNKKITNAINIKNKYLVEDKFSDAEFDYIKRNLTINDCKVSFIRNNYNLLKSFFNKITNILSKNYSTKEKSIVYNTIDVNSNIKQVFDNSNILLTYLDNKKCLYQSIFTNYKNCPFIVIAYLNNTITNILKEFKKTSIKFNIDFELFTNQFAYNCNEYLIANKEKSNTYKSKINEYSNNVNYYLDDKKPGKRISLLDIINSSSVNVNNNNKNSASKLKISTLLLGKKIIKSSKINKELVKNSTINNRSNIMLNVTNKADNNIITSNNNNNNNYNSNNINKNSVNITNNNNNNILEEAFTEKDKKKLLKELENKIKIKNKINVYISEYDTLVNKQNEPCLTYKIYDGSLLKTNYLKYNPNLLGHEKNLINTVNVNELMLKQSKSIFVPNDMKVVDQKLILKDRKKKDGIVHERGIMSRDFSSKINNNINSHKSSTTFKTFKPVNNLINRHQCVINAIPVDFRKSYIHYKKRCISPDYILLKKMNFNTKNEIKNTLTNALNRKIKLNKNRKREVFNTLTKYNKIYIDFEHIKEKNKSNRKKADVNKNIDNYKLLRKSINEIECLNEYNKFVHLNTDRDLVYSNNNIFSYRKNTNLNTISYNSCIYNNENKNKSVSKNTGNKHFNNNDIDKYNKSFFKTEMCNNQFKQKSLKENNNINSKKNNNKDNNALLYNKKDNEYSKQE